VGLWSKLRKTFAGGSHNSEIQDELRVHLEMDVAGGPSARLGCASGI
jgi:hypothetical protein